MDLLPTGQHQGVSKHHSDLGSCVIQFLEAFLGLPFEIAYLQLDPNIPVYPTDSNRHILNLPLLLAVV